MKFSIVIPSYLGPYAGSAKDRDRKLIRAVNSCLAQSFTDFEVLVIADGCEKTVTLLSDIDDPRLGIYKIQRHKLWSGYPRNTGIEQAKGEFITYLDIDDIIGEHHLEIINNRLNGFDWVWYNDLRYDPRNEIWFEQQCNIKQVGLHGTSNITHKTSLQVRWDENGRYAHDYYYFVQKLLKFTNFTKIQTPEYYVCHVPGTVTSGGYDL